MSQPILNSLSGYKDTDREILLKLSDKDLISACATNKYLFYSVCDDNFFHKKLLLNYPDTLKYYTSYHYNYKKYYLKIIYYVSKLKEEFNYSYVTGNPQTQYNIFKNSEKAYDKDGELLYQAIKNGELELVKEAVKNGVNIRKDNEYALTQAVFYRHLEIVKYLVSLGLNIDRDNEYTLRLAAEQGDFEMVKYLVSLGADIHIDNEFALRKASLNGHLPLVKYLVSIGADITANNDEPLRNAKYNGNFQVFNYLKSLYEK